MRNYEKVWTLKLIFKLIALNSKRKVSYRKEKRNKQLWNTFYCAHIINKDVDGNKRAKYCKRVECRICSRNKMGKYINSSINPMKEIIEKENLYFTTLTIKNVDVKNSIRFINCVKKFIKREKDRYRKENKKSAVYFGKFEFTIAEDSKIHPHYHIINNFGEGGNGFIQRYLKFINEVGFEAEIAGQDVKDIRAISEAKGVGFETSLIELLKYSIKVDIDDSKAYILAELLESLNNIHLLSKGGFKYEKNLEKEFNNDDYKIYEWNSRNSLWILSSYAEVEGEFISKITGEKEELENISVKEF